MKRPLKRGRSVLLVCDLGEQRAQRGVENRARFRVHRALRKQQQEKHAAERLVVMDSLLPNGEIVETERSVRQNERKTRRKREKSLVHGFVYDLENQRERIH